MNATTLTAEAIQEIRNADPVTARATAILGWLIGRGGSVREFDFEQELAPRTVHASGTVSVHTAIIGHNVLFRRGYIQLRGEARYECGTIHVTPEGYAYFKSLWD